VEFLRNQGISHLVVACNAMSTVLPYWSINGAAMDFHITGVIQPTISAVLAFEGVKVGVLGRRRTILSGAYSRPLRKNFRSVTQRIAQPLSAFIEKGEKDMPLFQSTLKKIVMPLNETDILLLACTHYSAAQDAFQKLAPSAKIINPTLETFQWVSKNWRLVKNSASDIFYATGNPAEMRTSSLKAFGVTIGEITSISLR